MILEKKIIELVVISDVHLGTYGSRAEELNNYLNSINPKTLVLNGDFIDIWQFNKNYFPTSNMQVIKTITSMLTKGTTIYYITGNHDEMLRKFNGISLGQFHIVNKLVLELDGHPTLISISEITKIAFGTSTCLTLFLTAVDKTKSNAA